MHFHRSSIAAVRPARALAISLLLAVFSIPLAPSLVLAHEPGEEEEEKHAPARTAPVLLERAEPVYPELARKDGIGGTISLEITVGADGATSSVKVIKGAGYGLDEAAVEAAKNFKFKPATEAGKPIASIVLFDQRFVVRPHLTAEASAEPPPTDSEAAPPPLPALPEPAPKTTYESTVVGRGPTSAASASSIRNLDFDLRPKTSPNDILRVVPGLLAVQHQGGGKADQLFLRGFDADHGTDVGVFIDGIPVNMPSHAHGQGFADLHWLIPEAIERIDVVKGPYDVRYGDFSTAGAINLITRKTFDESSLQLTLGSFPGEGCKHFGWVGSDSYDCKVLATQRFVGIAAPNLEGTWAKKLHPWIAFEAAHDDGPFVNPEKLDRYNLFAKVTYDVAPSTTLGIFFQAYGSQWTGSGQIPEREVQSGRLSNFGSPDPSEGGLTQRQMLTAFLHHKSGDSEVNATAYITRYRLSLWNDFTFYLNDPVNGSEIEQDDSRVFSGLKVDYHFHRRWNGISFRTTMGVEARYDSIHVDRWDAESCSVNGTPADQCAGNDFRKRLGRHVDSSDAAFNGSNDDITQLNIAGFLEEDVVFSKYIRAIAGLRADYFGFNVSDAGETLGAGMKNTSGTAQKATASPKLSLVIAPIPGKLDLYVNYGTGFHTNMAQVALNDGLVKSADGQSYTVHAVPQLYGGEFGARGRLFDRVDLAGAFWVSYLQNETVFSADSGTFEPAAPTLRLGLDLEARVKILDWLFVDFDLAQSSATARPDSGNGGAVALAPKLYMTGGITVKHSIGAQGAVRGGLRFRYLGDRPAFDESSAEYQKYGVQTINGAPNPDYNPARVIAQGYTVVDLYGAYRYHWFEVGVSIQNLLNSTWREAQFGNQSCTRDETYNSGNANYGVCGVNVANRTGVTDVHYTPGVPFNLQLSLKASF